MDFSRWAWTDDGARPRPHGAGGAPPRPRTRICGRLVGRSSGRVPPGGGRWVGKRAASGSLPRSLAQTPPPEEVGGVLGGAGLGGATANPLPGGGVTFFAAT